MAVAAAARYRAFISYSHQDERWGRWLHRALETYRVPRRLVGRETPAGTIPRRLLPIFRDRDEMASSSELAGTINEALSDSAFQIVICSPHAASSRWVNEEIKAFKRLGRERRILAFIVDGTPNASESPAGLAECFPRALRHRLDDRGEIGEAKAEVVGADARPGKDGRENAKLKLIAGLLGIGFDELKQREKARQRFRALSIIAMIIAVGIAMGAALRAQQQMHAAQERIAHLDRITDLGREGIEAGQFTRGATYLTEAYASGRNTADVRFLLARAMSSVDAMTLKSVSLGGQGYTTNVVYSPDGKRVVLARQGARNTNSVLLLDWASGSTIASFGDVPYAADATFSPGGERLLLSGIRSSDDHTMLNQVYDLGSGKKLFEMQGSSERWRADGTPGISAGGADELLAKIVYLDADHRAHIWQGAERQSIALQSGPLVSAKLSANGSVVVTGGEDGEIAVWDAQRGVRLRTLQTRPPKPTAAFVLHKLIVALGENGAISLWDAASLQLQGLLSGHGEKVLVVRLDGAGRRLLTRASGEPARVWDLATQRSIFVTPDRDDAYGSLDLTPDGKWLVAGSQDRSASLFSLEGGARVATFDGHNGPTLASTISPDSAHMLTAGFDGFVREWSLDAVQAVPLRVHSHAVDQARYNAINWAGFDSTGEIVSVGSDSAVRVWHQDGLVREQRGHVDAIVAASFSADGRRLITGSSDRTARVWDVASGNSIAVLAGAHNNRVERVALSADGSLAATIDFVDPVAHVWDVQSGKLLASLKGHAGGLRYVQFAGSSAHVVTASGDRTAKVWDARSGQLLFSLEGHSAPVWAAVASPDGQRIVTVSADHSARLWNAADGKLIQTITADDGGELESVTFTRDSNRVAIGADNGMVLIWDLPTGELRRLTGLEAGFSDQVAFSPDETLVASPRLASSEIGVWSVESGRLLMKWKDPKRHFFSVAFSPDGKRLVAAGPANGDTADFPVFDVSLETRTPEQIAAIIRCKSPWKVDGERLLPHAPEAPNCPGLVEAHH
ncbi:MAG TPA: TIR domain-containing protein [Nevskiaceae bacterium]|nr:TIR domain-containing protein [Nevskiaceae bacterium]